jgi:hypothetical protein
MSIIDSSQVKLQGQAVSGDLAVITVACLTDHHTGAMQVRKVPGKVHACRLLFFMPSNMLACRQHCKFIPPQVWTWSREWAASDSPTSSTFETFHTPTLQYNAVQSLIIIAQGVVVCTKTLSGRHCVEKHRRWRPSR